jgi:hypothetical protein
MHPWISWVHLALSHSKSKLTIFAKTPFPYSVNSSCMFRSLSAPGDIQYLSSLGKKGEPHYLGTQVVPSPPHLSVIRVWMAAWEGTQDIDLLLWWVDVLDVLLVFFSMFLGWHPTSQELLAKMAFLAWTDRYNHDETRHVTSRSRTKSRAFSTHMLRAKYGHPLHKSSCFRFLLHNLSMLLTIPRTYTISVRVRSWSSN